MHHNNFNWYSTNSYKRYQQKVQTPRLDQFSDEGRVPLGHPDDPENIAMQELVIASATPEEVEQWKAFAKQQREGSLLARRRLGLPYEDWGDKYRSFPVKKHEDQTANLDHQGGSDTSQAKKNEYKSRFVLNRKLNARPNSASTPSSHLVPSTSAQNDEIFIDDSNSSAKTNMRMVVSGDKIKTVLEKQPSPSSQNPRITTTKSPVKPVQQQENVTVEKSVSPPVAPSTSTSVNTVQECILFKHGHCFDPKGCIYTHVGTGGGDVALKPKPIIWSQKTPSIEICPGYENFSCWDTKCQFRHVAYLSDPL